MTVNVHRVDMGNIHPPTLEKWAELYCQIWKEPPWNEAHWTPEGVIQNISAELARPGAEALIAISEGEVVGFTWGYEVAPDDMTKIAGSSYINYIFRAADNQGQGIRMFYVDELGVGRLARHHRLGEALSAELIRTVRERHGINHFVLRTDKNAVPARYLYRKLGFLELCDVEDAQYKDRTYWILDTIACNREAFLNQSVPFGVEIQMVESGRRLVHRF